MKNRSSPYKGGFTLLETVIAIGVLAVLLTGFMYVFGPAAAGIKKAINIQQADRLVSTLEQELVTLRGSAEQTNLKTGFNKAFEQIKASNPVSKDPATALLIYQYRGDLSSNRDDGTPTPFVAVKGTSPLPGQDYTLQTMVRTKSDTKLKEDLAAVEGGVYYVICTQLIFNSSGELTPGKPGEINNPKPNSTPPDPNYKSGPFNDSNEYPEAVIAFNAEFFALNNRSVLTFDKSLDIQFKKAIADPPTIKPIFSRNLAVRR